VTHAHVSRAQCSTRVSGNPPLTRCSPRVVHCRTGTQCEPGPRRTAGEAPDQRCTTRAYSTLDRAASARVRCAASGAPGGGRADPSCPRVPGAMQHARFGQSTVDAMFAARGALPNRDPMRARPAANREGGPGSAAHHTRLLKHLIASPRCACAAPHQGPCRSYCHGQSQGRVRRGAMMRQPKPRRSRAAVAEGTRQHSG
jgi:hypothetical protein